MTGNYKPFLYAVVVATFMLLFWRAMLPSAGDPEDVVRSYLGHMRILKVEDNYDLLSATVKAELKQQGIGHRDDYFEERVGRGAGMSRYELMESSEEGELARIRAEVAFTSSAALAVDPNEEASRLEQTYDFLLLENDGHWYIDQLTINGRPSLP